MVPWDHPRTCGENIDNSQLIVLALGSPPHLRGKPVSLILLIFLMRITPAPAGKTHSVIKTGSPPKDHPRTCGENPLRFVLIVKNLTSPPHLRGKPLFCSFWERIGEDHPRTCGENVSTKSRR